MDFTLGSLDNIGIILILKLMLAEVVIGVAIGVAKKELGFS